MHIQPYLFFEGRCEEALAFYRERLGAELTMLMRFAESPDPETARMVPPEAGDKVMHAELRIGETVIMASDGRCSGQPAFAGAGFSLALNVSDAATAERLFAALGEGGQVQMPMAATFYAERFGVVADRFGVSWMIVGPAPTDAAA